MIAKFLLYARWSQGPYLVEDNGVRLAKLQDIYKDRFGKSFYKQTGLDMEILVSNIKRYLVYKDGKVFPKDKFFVL